MGRGRAKAKQQKVARELKYNTHFTDLDALQRELGVSGTNQDSVHGQSSSNSSEAADEYDDYEDWTGTER